MFDHFTTLEEIFSYKLATALSMEHDSLELLGELEKAAMRSEISEILHGHAEETRLHIQNLEQCFAMMGQESKQYPSPTTKGLAKEAKSFMAKTDNTLVDAVVVASALESEHHEVAVYESLILQARALGTTGVVELLSQNLLQEQSAIDKLKASADTLSRADAADRDSADTEPDRSTEDQEAVVEFPPYLPPGSI